MPESSSLRVAVLGVGAVGGFFGGRLARAGHDVTFIARGETLAALRERGLRVESLDGDFDVEPAATAETPEEVGPVDLVLLGVKAWQVAEVAPRLTPLLRRGTALLPLQNGVDAPSELARVHGAEHALGGLCSILCERLGPAHLRHSGGRPSVTLGELDNRSSERVEAIRAAFEGAGVSASVPESIQRALWTKFLMITALGGVGAAARAPLGELRGRPGTRWLLEASMREVVAVAAGQGVAIAADAVDETMGFIDKLPPDGTASMQRDLMKGRPSELEAQTGALVRFGEAAGVATPVSRTLYALLEPLEARARGGGGDSAGAPR